MKYFSFESTDYCWWPWIWFSAAQPIHRNIKPVFCGCVRKTMGRKGTLNRDTFHCFSHAVYRSRWHTKKNRGTKQKKETYRNEQLVAVWWNRCVSIIIYLWKWHSFSFLFFHFQLIVCNYAFGFWAFLLFANRNQQNTTSIWWVRERRGNAFNRKREQGNRAKENVL